MRMITEKHKPYDKIETRHTIIAGVTFIETLKIEISN